MMLWRKRVEQFPERFSQTRIARNEIYQLHVVKYLPIDRTADQLDHLVGMSDKISLDQLDIMILEAVAKRQSFSFQRVGDGEGTYLSLDAELPRGSMDKEVQQEAMRRINRIMFTDLDIRLSGQREIFQGLKDAYLAASVLQLPSVDRMRQSLRGSWRGYYGMASAVDMLYRNRSELKAGGLMLNAAPVGRSAQVTNLLGNVDRIGLITCHQQLAGQMANLGVDDVHVHLIPPQRNKLSGDQKKNNGALYPDRHQELLTELSCQRDDRLYFVAAGILAKQYCHLLQQTGNVALDFGSAIDRWVGINSRGDADNTVSASYQLDSQFADQ